MIVASHIGFFYPFENTLMNRIELYNEVTITVVTYHLFLFTDFVPGVKQQYAAGFSVIAVTCLNILINFIVMIYMSI